MIQTRSGLTFAATIEQPKCMAKLTMTGEFKTLDAYSDALNGTMDIQCELVAGHRHSRHQVTGQTEDGDSVEIYWTKKKG